MIGDDYEVTVSARNLLIVMTLARETLASLPKGEAKDIALAAMNSCLEAARKK